jgi:hypothetical protein
VWIQRANGGAVNPVTLAFDTRGAVTGTGTGQNISAMERFDVGEIVEVWGLQTNTSNVTILGTSGFNEGTRIMLYWLGP